MKTCSRCGEIKDASDFCRAARETDGLQYWCKVCMTAYAAAHRPERALCDAKRKPAEAVYDKAYRTANGASIPRIPMPGAAYWPMRGHA